MVNLSFGISRAVRERPCRFNAETTLVTIIEEGQLTASAIVIIILSAQVIVVNPIVTLILKRKLAAEQRLSQGLMTFLT